MGIFDRTDILVGIEGRKALQDARVAIYGLGGVGAACAMDLVRIGVGHFYVVDFDLVEESNLNRLYFGYYSTVGRPKADVFAQFARDVNPEVEIEVHKRFFSGADAAQVVDDRAGYHADCIDSLNAKISLLEELCRRDVHFIAAMGTAGRLCPERLKIGSIWQTKGCPLAKSVRVRLRHRGVTADFPVVWSDEEPVKPVAPESLTCKQLNHEGTAPVSGRVRMVQGSGPFVPQVAGHLMASWITRQILANPAHIYPPS